MLLNSNGYFDLLVQFGKDGSVNSRFLDIWFCLSNFFTNWGLPSGFHKVSSGYGVIIYSMGWFGVLLIMYIYMLLRHHFCYNNIVKLIPLFITIIMFSAIQFSIPLLSFLIAYSTTPSCNYQKSVLHHDI